MLPPLLLKCVFDRKRQRSEKKDAETLHCIARHIAMPKKGPANADESDRVFSKQDVGLCVWGFCSTPYSVAKARFSA
jgi:hypothetical protein